MRITGTTRLIAVVGDPIDHARAPEALNELIHRLGIDVVTIPVGIAPDGLQSLVKAARSWRNLAGLLITMPYKLEFSWLVDQVSARARITSAINVVRRTDEGDLIGDQTDGAGFVGGLAARQIPIAHRKVCMFGAGGVARAIAFAMLEEGAESVGIINRSKERAAVLCNDLTEQFGPDRAYLGDPASIGASKIIINATSVGSELNPGLIVDPQLLPTDAMVAEVVAKPSMTELLLAAEVRGCTVVRGSEMQQAQWRSVLEFLVPDMLEQSH